MLRHAEEPDIERPALGDAQDPQAHALPQGTLSGRELDPEAGEAVLTPRPAQAGLQSLPHGNDGPDPPSLSADPAVEQTEAAPTLE